MADESAELNVLRDELRAAVRGLDASAARVVEAIDHADQYLRGQRRTIGLRTVAPRPGQRLTTPAHFDPHEDPAFLQE